MKANTKYTALELLTAAKVVKPETLIGKVRVRIGGLPVNKPDHVINVTPGTTELAVLVGQDDYTIAFDGDEAESAVSAGARASLDAEGAAIKATDKHLETTESVEE